MFETAGPAEPPPPVDYTGCTDDDLWQAVDQLCALEQAVRAQRLVLVAEIDRRRAWRVDGARSLADALTLRLGLSFRTTRTEVDVAAALEDLPAIAGAFAAGRLTFEQVRPLCLLADETSDAEWAEEARQLSVAELERRARHRRRPSTADARDAHARRQVRTRTLPDATMGRLTADLPLDDLARVVAALDRHETERPPAADERSSSGVLDVLPPSKRRADALVDLAASAMEAGADADRSTVVVFTPLSTLTGSDSNDQDVAAPTPAARGAPERAELADGTPLAAETARRLACDGRVQLVLTDERRRPVGVGRVTRTVPPWLMRLLHQRDHGCRFPGCGRQNHLHGHHIEHWARGGSTDLPNLVLLCPHHHRLVHEGGAHLVGAPDAELRFLRPDGRPYCTGPPGLDPAVRRRFGEAA